MTADTPNCHPLEDRQASNSEASTSNDLQPRITSSNAYMLLYRQKQDVEPAALRLPPRWANFHILLPRLAANVSLPVGFLLIRAAKP